MAERRTRSGGRRKAGGGASRWKVPGSRARGTGEPARARPGTARKARGSGRSEEALREALVATCRRLEAKELIGAGEGNLSCRLGPGRLLVTPSGRRKGELLPGDLLVVDPAGRLLEGRGRPSSELAMHLAAYGARPDAEALVHAHPLHAIALTVAGLPPPEDLVPEASVVLGPIALCPFATPGTAEVPASLLPALPGHDVLLLERHGALCLGRSLAEACDRLETLERVAKVAVLARLLGRCEPLPAGAVARVLEAAVLGRKG